MIRHVVLLTFDDTTTPDAMAGICDELRKLPSLIPEISGYTVGTDAGVNAGNADLAVVGDFDNVDDYLVYRDHPDHRRVIETHIAPTLASRSAIQYEL